MTLETAQDADPRKTKEEGAPKTRGGAQGQPQSDTRQKCHGGPMASTRPGDKQPTDPDGPSGYADLQEDIQRDEPMHEAAKNNVKGGSNVTVDGLTRAELVRPCINEVKL